MGEFWSVSIVLQYLKIIEMEFYVMQYIKKHLLCRRN